MMFLLFYFLVAFLVTETISNPCLRPKRLKPCFCESFNSTEVRILCVYVNSWTELRLALKPLRKSDFLIDFLYVEGIQDSLSIRAKRIFRNLNVGSLTVKDCLLANRRGDLGKNLFKNSTIFDLTLQSVKLKRVPTRALAGLPMMRSLNLAGNLISGVGHKAFQHQRENLKYLDLQNNRLKQFPMKMFRELPNLEILLLKHNLIGQILKNDLKHLQNLRGLDLSDNRIISIHSDAFSYLEHLESIALAFNPLQRISNSLQNLAKIAPNLSSVDLSGTEIPIDHFKDVNLNSIVLQSRKERFLAEKLVKFPQLKQLDLASNFQLKTREFAYSNFDQVEELDIGNTHLTLEILSKFPNLRKFYAEWVPIKKFGPRKFSKQAGKLEILSIRNCRLRSIHKRTFNGLARTLKILDLSHNELKTVHKDTFSKLIALEEVDLSYNRFIEDCHRNLTPLHENLFFRSRRTLRILNLANARIRNFPRKLLGHLTELTDLNLMGNELVSVNMDLGKNRKLRYLNLQNNQIEYIHPHAFIQLHNLQELYLGLNEMYETKFNTLMLPPSLESLGLKGVVLASVVSPYLSHLPNLRQVDLSANQIRRLRPDTFHAATDSLIFLDLSKNPLDCSCSLRSFVEWLSSSRVTVSRSTECFFPELFRGHSLLTRVCWARCTDNEKQKELFDFCLTPNKTQK